MSRMKLTQQRPTRAALVILTALAVLGAFGSGAGTAGAGTIRAVVGKGALVDLSPEANATDGARGLAISIVGRGSTETFIIVWGLDGARAGEVHGAHVHTGSCVAGNGAAAGPHWNAGDGVSHHSEVWLDFTITPWGFGFARSEIPHEIPKGAAGAIVIHASPTAPDGTAGARLACLPMQF